ncbi:NADAR family protein [Lacrimispora sp.]|uniref:NADAR family protein n=1 Tax=Lacrimispora sp. TaxID=2719234 RepID=UPI0028B0C448|nr:NADAR family protein [Lacrimispora sp.]
MVNYKKSTYNLEECITFWKTNEKYGGLSNMAPGYKIFYSDTQILTSEALYQACKFPDHPNIQKAIIRERSPITAKRIAQKNSNLVRKDWTDNRIKIMNWSLHLKLLYNWKKFGLLLDSTEDKMIVEISTKDDFWGAYKDNSILVGSNVLGRLLCSLRSNYRENSKNNYKTITLGALDIPDFRLFNEKIPNLTIDITQNYNYGETYSVFDYLN